MSWFDTTGLANIAKSALKEAQKTIDKALDIKEDDIDEHTKVTPIDTNAEDFFGGWGLVSSGMANENDVTKKQIDKKCEEIVTKSPTRNLNATSLWGSFTGSFFDTAALPSPTPTSKPSARPNRDSVESLDDSVDLILEPFSTSKLVVQQDNGDLLRRNSIETERSETQEESNSQTNTVKKREKSSTSHGNRLSAISCESSKNSSESVEIVSSECTTSPDSEAISLGQCISNSSSILESKPNSESVEVLLTSPSSVEVLSTSDGRPDSQFTNEFVSPLQSPDEPYLEEKDTPDSVEVIPDDQEESAAEDTVSYTSLSESTSATVLDNAFNFSAKSRNNKDAALTRGDTVLSVTSINELSPDNGSEPVTKAPGRNTMMHLPIMSKTVDVLGLLKSASVIDYPVDDGPLEVDEGFHSDKTLVPENQTESSSSDTSTTTTTESNANSLYLKNMIADAMKEKDGGQNSTSAEHREQSQTVVEQQDDAIDYRKTDSLALSLTELEMLPPRETSPTSSGSRSDLVKIGSDQTSGHTSGDELETTTTTSSDIEIISSPNGCDSSSTHSRQSPAKLLGKGRTNRDDIHAIACGGGKLKKGHNRELSETSSISDDSELERLLRRLTELTDLLETREAKLIECNRKNIELETLNNDYRQQLDSVFRNQIDPPIDLSQVTEEYTQRLSALERKFQQAIREKDLLRKQVEQYKQEAATRLNKTEIDRLMQEKEETIRELRDEGEKLSKQQLQHSNIIKKLRVKEKENESTIKHLKEKIEELSSESDRMKKSLSAKEDLERNQIDAVHQLSERNKKCENEIVQLKEQIEDVTQRYETTKKSLDAAKKELIDKGARTSELQHRQKMVENLEKEKEDLQLQNEELINQLEELRLKLRRNDEEMSKKDQHLRSDNNELMRRLEDAERRNEELSQSLLDVSKPLVQQLDSLQASHNKKVANLEKVEQTLSSKLNELQTKLQLSRETEKTAKDEQITLRSKLASLETQLNDAARENQLINIEMEKRETEYMLKEQELKRANDSIREDLKLANDEIERFKSELKAVQERFAKVQMDAQKEANQRHGEDERDDRNQEQQVTSLPNTRNTSPTLSLGKLSMTESLGSSFWPSEDVFDLNQTGGVRCTNMLEMQLLQTNLKARDGEVQQLQWELKRREHERTLLNNEIAELLARVERLEEKCADHEKLTAEYVELQQQYDTLCQLYGEKVEENEELKLDLQDVKDMYKSQIDELLKQQKMGK